MDFLGVGPLELVFILLIILLVVGPKDVSKTARTVGHTINRLRKSETWQTITLASRELRTLPDRLAKEAELEELKKVQEDVNAAVKETTAGMSAWTEPTKPPARPPPGPPPAPELEPSASGPPRPAVPSSEAQD